MHLPHLWGFGAAETGNLWHIVPPDDGQTKGGTPPLCRKVRRRPVLVQGRPAVALTNVCGSCLTAWHKREEQVHDHH